MRNLFLVAAALTVAVFIAACGSPPTTAVPTADNATVEPTVTPNPEGAEEGTVEATAEATSDSTDEAEMTAEATAEGTEAAMEPGFAVQISGGADGDVTLDSEDGAVVVASAASVGDAQASSSGQQVLDTPSTELRTLTFTNADQSYTFDLIFSADLAPGLYQIGVNNVQTTIGNNINENSAGEPSSAVGGSAEATGEATSEADAPAGASTSTAQAGGSTAENTEVPSANDSSAAASNPAGGGVVERDETFAPTIAARLELSDPDALSYNLVQGGMLNIESIDDSSASGSFEFTLSPADDPTQTITVTGSFTDLPLGDMEPAEAQAEPTTAVDVEIPATSEATMEATEETTAAP
jgi:hypothetical protein